MSPETFEPNYIAVEGVIGVGKTTFAGMLAERLQAELLNEEVFENPFLVDYYKNSKRFAFACQLYFLISRFQQQQQLMVRDLFAQRIVADYLFAKDTIFASVTLSERELALYNKIAPILARDVPRPDLVIYLQIALSKLVRRIGTEGSTLEKNISEKYLEDICEAYDYFFFNYQASPLLVVKADDIDLSREEDVEDLIEKIGQMKKDTLYYVPLSKSSKD